MSCACQQAQVVARGALGWLQDPQTGTRLGLQLARLHTCRPGDASPTSLLLSDDAGLRSHASTAARGSIQKQFAVEGLALYWEPGRGPGAGSSDGQAAAADQAAGLKLSPQRSPAKSPAKLGLQASQQAQQPPSPPPSYVLHPTDFAVHCTLQLSGAGAPADGSGGGGSSLRVHAAAVLHHLQLSLDAKQAADMVALADRLAWCAARNKHAAYCPDGWRQPGPLAVPWR